MTIMIMIIIIMMMMMMMKSFEGIRIYRNLSTNFDLSLFS